MSQALLSVENLHTVFFTEGGTVRAVTDVSFSIAPGEFMGVVGESGSGKSVTALSIMGLILPPAGRITHGKIVFEGKDLLQLPSHEQRQFRGKDISMVFQEPMTSLNPVMTVGAQIAEVLLLHRDMNRKQAWAEAVELLKRVGIPSPETRVRDYPHSMSGGMRQRVMIAMALACRPKLLICDEPTTALDVTIQAQILSLLVDLQKEFGMAVMFITHDLGLVAELCDSVMVMYAGRVIEEAPASQLFRDPQHPYTQALLGSTPRLGARLEGDLPSIPGIVPDLRALPIGCSFAERCSVVEARCMDAMPALRGDPGQAQRKVRCVRHGN